MSQFLKNLTYYLKKISHSFQQVIKIKFLTILIAWLHTNEIYAATYTLSTASTAENGGYTLSNGDTLRITSTGSIDRGPTGWFSVKIPQNGTIINQGTLTGNSAVGGLILIATKPPLTLPLFIIVPSAQSIPSFLDVIVPLLLIVVFIFAP